MVLASPVIAQNTEKTEQNIGTLTVVIVELKSDDGDVKVNVFNSEESFLATPKEQKKMGGPFQKAIAPIEDNKAEVVFEDLPFGEYAIKLFHDENGNGKLDKNFVKMPKEDYAFSNNARGNMGLPKYEDAKFEFDQEEMTIEITIP
jgi:uncharacterized protein (DUF2141 family)